jgi:hypothetical protein
MSLWDEKFRNHPIHETLSSISVRLEVLASEISDQTASEHIQRLLEVMSYAKLTLSASTPSFVPEGTLNTMHKILTNIVGDLKGYDADKNVNNFQTANGRAENLLTNLQQIPKFVPSPDLKDALAYTSKFQESVNNIITNLNQKREQLEAKFNDLSERGQQNSNTLDQLTQTIEQQKGRLDAAITEYQKQFSEAEDRRREQFESASTQRGQQFETFIRQTKTDIGQFMDAQRQNVTDAMNANKERLEKKTTELSQSADTLFKGHQEEAKSTIEFLGKKKAEAQELVHVIGNIGVTGNYNNIATSERRKADRWRVIAIVFMLLVVMTAAFIAFYVAKQGLDWRLVTFRMAVTLILLVPAFYARSESEKHRKREQQARKMELELASIDPYLELLPPDKRVEIKGKLTERFFGQPEPTAEKEDFLKSSVFIDILKEVGKMLKAH